MPLSPFQLPDWRQRWFPSRIDAQSSLGDDDDGLQADYRLLADALRALLAQCTRRGAERQFPAALVAAALLRRQSRNAAPFSLPAQQLSDVAHEIAQHVAPATLAATLRCLRRAARGSLSMQPWPQGRPTPQARA